MRLTDDEAYETFKSLRWADTQGEPYCGKCGCTACYFYKRRKNWQCKGCGYNFSVTSGTIFANRKLFMRDILAAIAIFVNGAKGHSALQLSRDLDVQYRTAFVMAHKLQEVLAKEQNGAKLSGSVEIDGAYFGGYVKPANYVANRIDRRLAMNQTGKRECLVVMRQRNGSTVPYVSKSEHAAVPEISAKIAPGSTIYADDAKSWDPLHSHFSTKRINHSECYSDGEACTNWAESYFSRIRRSEIGIHHKIAGPYLSSYADEMAWREDHRKQSNGRQYAKLAGAALKHPVSRQWKGYWQRHIKTAAA
jgi:transposase-like protein